MKVKEIVFERNLESIKVILLDGSEVLLKFDGPLSAMYNRERIKRLGEKGLVKNLEKTFHK